jgi:hypothetical protein
MQIATTTERRAKPGPKQSLDKSVDLFWQKVDQSAGRFGCWPWAGSKKEKGYGQAYFMGKVMRAHRLAYELAIGPVPNGLMLCHFCDNPACCNPWHLAPGTAKQNTQDMIAKGRANFINNLPNMKAKTQ